MNVVNYKVKTSAEDVTDMCWDARLGMSMVPKSMPETTKVPDPGNWVSRAWAQGSRMRVLGLKVRIAELG